jgi:uncharacterized protein (TIGR02302 family)
MVAERLARCFWPFWTVFALVLAPLMMGWQDMLPVEAVWTFAVVAVVGLGSTLFFGARRFRWPTEGEAVARVDASLPGRPIAALADQQAIGAGDMASEAVWRAHVQRMAERARAAKPVEPDLRISSRDRFGLRLIALLFLVAAFMFGSVWRVGSVAEMGPTGGQALASGPVWEGWVEPPAHTGRPSLYLADIPSGAVRLPEGSRVTLRLYGEVGALTVSETISGRTEDIGSASDTQQAFEVAQEGELSVSGPNGATWAVALIPDMPPQVEIVGAAEADAAGEMSLRYRASDDYGVMSGTAIITLDLPAVDRQHGLVTEPERRGPLVLDLPMPFTGDRTAFEQTLIENLSEHPYANLPVRVMLEVQDAPGQIAQSIPEAMVLPGRRFFQPVARAVIEQRRDLLWSKENAPRVTQILRAVSHRPADLFTSETTYLRLSVALRRLDNLSRFGELTDADRDEIAQALWDLAIQLEDGTLADARERLRRAQERLAEAMRDGASDAEIAELMNELREAMDDYMRMLGESAEPGDGTDQAQQDGMTVTQDELQALLDRIEELMQEGRMAEAAELMEQLNEMMENMQVTQGQGGDGPPSPGQQSMDELAETLRDQQGLSDDAFRDLQERFNPGQPGQPGENQPGQQGQGEGLGQSGGQQGQQSDQGPGGEGQPGQEQGEDGAGQSLADRQQALRDELRRQQDNLPGVGGEAGEAARRSLDQAEGAMDGAEQALREGDLAEAIDRQAEAMDALRDSIRNLGEALAQEQQSQPGQGQQAGEGDGQADPSRRDPLGRQLGNSGQYGSDENMLQGEDVYRRAEELLDEIRRRSSEQERPEVELDYLRRLLDRF